MWYSINEIIKPTSIKEAYSLQNKTRVLFSGGSYLVAEKNPSIQSLIDINDLLGDGVTASVEGVHIDAGATLQTFLDTVESIHAECRLLKGIKYSCPSKQIRNQRTFGGEIGKGRTNSEILVFLHVVNAELTVFKDAKIKTSIRDWDGHGIITQISYFPNHISSIELERFSVLESAPAVVIVSGIKRDNRYEFSIGGTSKIIETINCDINDWSNEKADDIANQAVQSFVSDHFGSLLYKEKLIAAGLKRVGEKL